MTTETKALAAPATIDLSEAIQAAAALGKEGVESLKELHAMARAERDDAARAAFFRSMADLHARIGSIPKNRTASFATKAGGKVSYRYADLHAIASALRKHTGALGLAWRWETVNDDSGVTVTCTASHRDGHSVASAWRAPIEGGNPMTSAPQKVKIATTFAQRVTLIQVFGLTDTEDDVDGVETVEDGSHGGFDGDGAPQDDPDLAHRAANLKADMESIGGDPTRFLKWLGVERVDDLDGAGIKRATDQIARLRREGRTL